MDIEVSELSVQSTLNLLSQLSEHLLVKLSESERDKLTPQQVYVLPLNVLNTLVKESYLLDSEGAKSILGLGSRQALYDAMGSGTAPLRHVQVTGDRLYFSRKWIADRQKKKKVGKK